MCIKFWAWILKQIFKSACTITCIIVKNTELCKFFTKKPLYFSHKQWYNVPRVFDKKGDSTMSEKSTFYLVREEILPEAIKKTIKVKEILKRGEIKTINEAVEKMGLSRSAYYKYKDFVFPFYEASKEKIITLSLLLEHKSGVLSKVLNTVADDSGSIMTINQGIPLQGVANTTISIETKHLTVDLEALLDKLRMIDGVKRLEVLGQV